MKFVGDIWDSVKDGNGSLEVVRGYGKDWVIGVGLEYKKCIHDEVQVSGWCFVIGNLLWGSLLIEDLVREE